MHHRHDISDKLWEFLRDRLPGRAGSIGCEALDNRTKVHLAVYANGVSVRVIITDGTTADCSQAEGLIKGIDNAKYLLADKAYDCDSIVEGAQSRGIVVVIPPRSNRKIQRFYDKELYKMRHRVENAFLRLK